jgi:hypothetical protein
MAMQEVAVAQDTDTDPGPIDWAVAGVGEDQPDPSKW